MSCAEYDANGILVTAGSARRAGYRTEREDAELAGAIRLRSQSQEVWLETEGLQGGTRSATGSPRGAGNPC